MILSEADYVEHFGVKGMSWGVRKERRREKKAAKKAALAKADQEYVQAVHKLVSGAAKKGNLVQLRTGNRIQIMTGKEAAAMILARKGAIPRNVMWNELEVDYGRGR
jgi:ribosomal protein S12